MKRVFSIHLIFVFTLIQIPGCDQPAGVWHKAMSLAKNAAHGHRYEEADNFFKLALEESEKFKADDNRRLKTLTTVAAFFSQRDRFDEAIPLYEQALAIREVNSGEVHSDVILERNRLVQLYFVVENYAKAESLGLPAAKMTETVLGENHPELAEITRLLGSIYSERQNQNEAESFYQRSLTIEENQTPLDTARLAIIINNLAVFYHDWGKLPQAEALYRRTLELNQISKGNESLDLIPVLNNLAGFYFEQNNLDSAWSLYSRSLTIYGKKRPRSNYKKIALLNKLAYIHSRKGEYPEAVKKYKRAVRLIDRGTGMHPDQIDILTGYEKVLKAEGELEKARHIAERRRKLETTVRVLHKQ